MGGAGQITPPFRGGEMDLPHPNSLNQLRGLPGQQLPQSNIMMQMNPMQNKLQQKPPQMSMQNVQDVMHNQQYNQGQLKQQTKPPQVPGTNNMSNLGPNKDLNKQKRRPTPSGEKRKDSQPKSPAQKKPKEIIMIKLFAVQQHYKAAPEPLVKEDEVNV